LLLKGFFTIIFLPGLTIAVLGFDFSFLGVFGVFYADRVVTFHYLVVTLSALVVILPIDLPFLNENSVLFCFFSGLLYFFPAATVLLYLFSSSDLSSLLFFAESSL